MYTAGELQRVAAEALRHFETFKRGDSGPTLYKLADSAPEWVQNMVFSAHGGMLPDDRRFEYIVAALHAIVDASDSAELDEVRAELEPDLYDHDLISWLASHGARQGYADEALQMIGEHSGIMDVLMQAQCLERQEVFDIVAQALTARLDAEEPPTIEVLGLGDDDWDSDEYADAWETEEERRRRKIRREWQRYGTVRVRIGDVEYQVGCCIGVPEYLRGTAEAARGDTTRPAYLAAWYVQQSDWSLAPGSDGSEGVPSELRDAVLNAIYDARVRLWREYEQEREDREQDNVDA